MEEGRYGGRKIGLAKGYHSADTSQLDHLAVFQRVVSMT